MRKDLKKKVEIPTKSILNIGDDVDEKNRYYMLMCFQSYNRFLFKVLLLLNNI